MQTEFIPGPYSLAGTEPIIIEGKEAHPGNLMRDNDGALIIMAPCDPEEFASDRKRIGTVGLTVDIKRGQGWKVTPEQDPMQMATARLFQAAPEMFVALVDMVGAYYDDGASDDEQPSMVKRAMAAIAKVRGL